jgi:hypothetical protein
VFLGVSYFWKINLSLVVLCKLLLTERLMAWERGQVHVPKMTVQENSFRQVLLDQKGAVSIE